MLTAREIISAHNIHRILDDPGMIASMRKNIQEGDLYIVREVIKKDKIEKILSYLKGIGLGSLPNYHKIEEGCPNFHRINKWDERAFVKGCFHQFAFFPWNQDLFDFFELAQPVYYLKNLLSGLRKDKFMGTTPEDDCTSRVAFQFYPAGIGGLNKHRDPVDYHQLTVPIMIMSSKGKDFQEGGVYVEGANGEHIILDDMTEPGDVIYFNAQVAHGVERIDPAKKENWLSFEGRWMMLFAVNKLSDNNLINNSVDLAESLSNGNS